MRAPIGLLVLAIVALAGLIAWSSFAPAPVRVPRQSASIVVVDLKPPAKTAAMAPAEPVDAKKPESEAHPPAPPHPPPAHVGEEAPAASAQAPAGELPPTLPVARLTLPVVAHGPALAAAPDEALVNRTEAGPLPIISQDGRKPWRAYARPFDASDKRPRIGIVVSGLGLSSAVTEAAIQGLPSAVTLAFAPYSAKLAEWIQLARAAGHEVLLNVPMEPLDYPTVDPGPKALLTSLTLEENQERLLWTLSRGVGYVGVADYLGSRFSMSREHLKPLLESLNARGLLYVDSRSAPRSLSPGLAGEIGIPALIATETLDDQIGREAIDAKLTAIEKAAKKDGRAVGIGSPYPVTLERLAAWLAGLEGRGVALAPVSALVGGGAAP